MPMTSLTYSKLPMVARGFADCVVGTMTWFDLPEGLSVTNRDFTNLALLSIAVECAAFLDAVETLHPDGKAGVRRAIKAHNLGWHFFLARQRTGIGYANFRLGDFGRGLDSLALRFPPIRVEIGDGKINFL